MFFRRMFQRKDSDDDDNNNRTKHGHNNAAVEDEDDDAALYYEHETHQRQHPNTHYPLADFQLHRSGAVSSTPRTQRKFGAAKPYSSANISHRSNLGGSGATTAVQLTPLWEHILRTRTLPPGTCPLQMFGEFHERLRDPEWQVRQHALRVFVDVLVVMRSKADSYMDSLIGQLVENLGHPAPTVRKGALDCLRVYLAETAMPETIMLQILDIGLHQKITNEPFGGRLTCGVMLSLPALVQSTLHTSKRPFILRSTVDMLVQKMGQVTHQEITLKVLSKLRDLIGESEFMELMSHGAYREFELLCNVYGVGMSDANVGTAQHQPNSWRRTSQQQPTFSNSPQQRHLLIADNCWRSSDEEQMMQCAASSLPKVIKCEKIILETEIKINDDTLTMRILEAKDDDTDCTAAEDSPCKSMSATDTYPNSLEDEIVCGRLLSARNSMDSAGVVQLLSDSEVEEIYRTRSNSTPYVTSTLVTPSTPSRTPKRVTFGGEIVKMRTPDSDAPSTNNHNHNPKVGDFQRATLRLGETVVELSDTVERNDAVESNESNTSKDINDSLETKSVIERTPSDETTTSADTSIQCNNVTNKTNPLSLEITNDNTKPLSRPSTAQSPKRRAPTRNPEESVENPSSIATSTSSTPTSPAKRNDLGTSPTTSPRSPFKRINISPVDSIISPKVQHKQIEVLHNLQRDPSPVRARRASIRQEETDSADKQPAIDSQADKKSQSVTPPPPKSWEELGIVDDDVLMDLRAGDWRLRSHGICSLEEALRSSDNLARVQPCLDTLLRVLLSSERNPEVAEDKRRLLMNLISRLPLDNLEDRTPQIMTGLCRQGGAGANRVCKALMQRLPPAVIVLKLISDEFLHAKSSRFREHALQMVMYALMTFPSTCFDTTTCVTNATYAALERKKRVRQAALEVLAILGQVTSPRAVLEVVQRTASTRDEGAALLAAVKARLSRKQLPLISADGAVQYTLRVPTPQHTLAEQDPSSAVAAATLQPDIEWINAGVGSVSPTSLKRRAQRHRSSSQQSFCCLTSRGAEVIDAVPSACGSNHSDESCTKHRFSRTPQDMLVDQEGSNDETQNNNIQYVLGSSAPLHFGTASKKSNVEYSNYANRRLVAKSCSDSSMDGRSSDSNYTSSSGGGGGVGGTAATTVSNVATNGGGGITGRFTRQAVNSRFPAMERLDLNSTYMRVHKPPTCYPGMGAYAQLQQQQYNMNSTYPKVNYKLPVQQQARKRLQQQQQQHFQNLQQQQQQQQPLQHQHFHHYQPTQQQQHYHQQQLSHSHQQQQQQQQQRNNCNVQDNFKQQEILRNEKNNNSNFNNNNNNSNYINNSNNNNNVADINDTACNLDGTYTICSAEQQQQQTQQQQQQQQHHHYHHHQQQIANGGNNGSRRFVNVEKFMKHSSNKYSQTNGGTATTTTTTAAATTTPSSTPSPTTHTMAPTPTSSKSKTASQKSASAKSRASCSGAKSVVQEPDVVGDVAKAQQEKEEKEKKEQEKKKSEKKEAAIKEKATAEEELEDNKCSTPTTTLVGRLHSAAADEEVGSVSPGKWSGNGDLELLQLEDVIDVTAAELAALQMQSHETCESPTEIGEHVLHRNASLQSVQSREESIRTQLEMTPTTTPTRQISRNQSVKSLAIEEDIEGGASQSFVVMQARAENNDEDTEGEAVEEQDEELVQHMTHEEVQLAAATEAKSMGDNEQEDEEDEHDKRRTRSSEACALSTQTPQRARSPTIAELKSLSRRNSMIKSMESLYMRPATRQQDYEAGSSTATDSSVVGHATPQRLMAHTPKPQHTPLKQKSKTTHVLKSSQRRISPIKRVTDAELYPVTMTRCERPRESLLKCYEQMEAANWETNIAGLKTLVRIVRHHSDTLDAHMHMCGRQLTKTVRNLRSQVARAACQAAGELFALRSKVLEQECDDLVSALLHRTADTNRFLRADAMRALEVMCDQLTPAKILNVLSTKGAQHQHAVVRTSAAKLLNRLMERLGYERVYALPRDQRDKFFVIGANLLLEGSLETRSYAKAMFKQLSQHGSYQRMLLEVIPQRTYRNVEKTLKSIR